MRLFGGHGDRIACFQCSRSDIDCGVLQFCRHAVIGHHFDLAAKVEMLFIAVVKSRSGQDMRINPLLNRHFGGNAVEFHLLWLFGILNSLFGGKPVGLLLAVNAIQHGVSHHHAAVFERCGGNGNLWQVGLRQDIGARDAGNDEDGNHRQGDPQQPDPA